MTDRIDLRVVPLAQIVPAESNDHDTWLAYGSDPSFRCHWQHRDPIAGGWYEIELDVQARRGTLHEPCFYPDYGRGVIEADKIVLPLRHLQDGSHRLRTLVRFSYDVIGLRFDPSVLPCEFQLRAFSVHRLGRLAAAMRMLDGLLERSSLIGKVGLVLKTVGNLLLGGPRRMADRMYHAFAAKPDGAIVSDYTMWMELYEDTGAESLQLAAAAIESLGAKPVFSIVVPVYNTAEHWLRRCIDSVIRQAYPYWELCIADDASSKPHVRRVLEEYARADSRIKVAFRAQNGHISHASNSALALATGDFIALLDHDDELSPLALLECAKAFDANPEWRMLFTDEDKIDEDGIRSDPYFKSDWNPDLFLSQNCVCHLSVYARELVDGVGGFRAGYEGAQDWDLTLRVIEQLTAGQIGHVPKVLYHWRMIEGSTALAPGEKGYAHQAGMRAIQSHLDRANTRGTVEEIEGYSGYYRIRYRLPEPEPLVSLLIPTRDGVDLLKQCVDSVLYKTDYDNIEIIILDNGSRLGETRDYFASLQGHPKVRVASFNHPFNFSAINNFGAKLARGSVIGLLNNDIEVISRGWLREMVSHALRGDIGVVGAMLYYPNDSIQHAGVILGIGGVAGHAYVGHWRGYAGDKHRAALVQNMSAVTAACLVVRASVYAEVGGLDEQLVVAFNDIDFCLRVRAAGYRNVWTPFAELYHHESATRGYENTPEKIARFKGEERFMTARWGRLLEQDPYYSPNFSLDTAPFSLAFPPRSWDGSGLAVLAGSGLHGAPETPPATPHAD